VRHSDSQPHRGVKCDYCGVEQKLRSANRCEYCNSDLKVDSSVETEYDLVEEFQRMIDEGGYTGGD
jgi:hypothetical protein